MTVPFIQEPEVGSTFCEGQTMNDDLVTFACLMAFESYLNCDSLNGDPRKRVFMIYCPTGESEEGTLEVTPRMRDLALMGFVPAAIARADPADIVEFSIYAMADLPLEIADALAAEGIGIVRNELGQSSAENFLNQQDQP
jgi:hypothetical protein